MTYRCPYCRETFETPVPGSECPLCHRTFAMPGARPRPSTDRADAAPRRVLWMPPERRGRKPPPLMATGAFRMLMVMCFLGFIGAQIFVRLTARASAGAPTPLASSTTWTTLMGRPDPAEVAARQQRSVTRNLATLRVALDQFAADCGRYPTTREGLAALIRNPGLDAWAGPYVIEMRTDPWQMPFGYVCDEQGILIFSPGPDREAHTEDDAVLSGPVEQTPREEPLIRATLLAPAPPAGTAD